METEIKQIKHAGRENKIMEEILKDGEKPLIDRLIKLFNIADVETLILYHH